MMSRRFFAPNVLLVLAFLLLHENSSARFGLDLTLWTAFDDNAFRNYEAIADQILQPGLSLYFNHERETDRFRAYYSGSWTGFKEYTQRQFILHNAGLNGQWTPGQIPMAFFGGAEYGFRRNESNYAYYDYRNSFVYLNIRYDEGKVASTFIGGSARNRRYREIPQFDFTEWAGFFRQHFYLPTRTTLIATATVGQKRFTESVDADAVPGEVIENIDPINTRGGKGAGNGKGNDAGKGKTPTQQAQETKSVNVSLPGHSVSQAIFSLRLAQSVSQSTGLAVEYGQREFIRGQGRYLSYQDGGYEENDILFDDPYNYSGKNLSMEITRILPFSILLKLGLEAMQKDYEYPAFDFDGDPIEGKNREDRMQSVRIQFTRPIPLFAFMNDSNINFLIQYILNDSNDPYFKYRGSLIGLGWQFRL